MPTKCYPKIQKMNQSYGQRTVNWMQAMKAEVLLSILFIMQV